MAVQCRGCRSRGTGLALNRILCASGQCGSAFQSLNRRMPLHSMLRIYFLPAKGAECNIRRE